jgi:hypothetical protein
MIDTDDSYSNITNHTPAQQPWACVHTLLLPPHQSLLLLLLLLPLSACPLRPCNHKRHWNKGVEKSYIEAHPQHASLTMAIGCCTSHAVLLPARQICYTVTEP